MKLKSAAGAIEAVKAMAVMIIRGIRMFTAAYEFTATHQAAITSIGLITTRTPSLHNLNLRQTRGALGSITIW